MSNAPERILVTGDEQYGFGCVHGDFPIGRTVKYVAAEKHAELQAECDALKVRVTELETKKPPCPG